MQCRSQFWEVLIGGYRERHRLRIDLLLRDMDVHPIGLQLIFLDDDL